MGLRDLIERIRDRRKEKNKPKPVPDSSIGFDSGGRLVSRPQPTPESVSRDLGRGSSGGGSSGGGGSSSSSSGGGGSSSSSSGGGGGSSSSSRTTQPTEKTDFEQQLEEQVKKEQTSSQRAFQEQLEKQIELQNKEQQKLQELNRQREFLDRQREAMKNQSVSAEEFESFAKKYADLNKKISEKEQMTSGGKVLQVGLPTGRESLTQRWSSKDKFSDLIYDSNYGQGTEIKKDKFFAGYTEAGTPEFVSAPTGMTTLGELQLEREIEKFGAKEKVKKIEKDFQKNIQEEYNKDIGKYADKAQKTYQNLVNSGELSVNEANKLLNQDIQNYSQSILDTKKYKNIEKKANEEIKKLNFPKDIEGLYQQSLKTKKQRIIENIPILGTGKEALESSRKYAELASVLSPSGEYKPIGLKKAGRKALFDIGMLGLDVGFVSGIGKAGVNISRQAIRREIAKRGSIGLEQLGKAKITGVNFIEEGGKFYMVGRQKAGNFIRNFKLEGSLIKQGKGYSFIPKGEGKSVVVGISKSRLTGVKGKAQELIGKMTGEPTSELLVMPETFEVAGAGVSRKVPFSLRGLEVSKGIGLGVYTPIESSYAKLTRKSTQSLREQLAKNIKKGGDPIVSQMVSPQFYGKVRGRQAGLELSKQREILNLLYKKPKQLKVERQFIKIAKDKAKSKKAYDFADDLISLEKKSIKKEPPIKTSGRTQTQLLYEKPKVTKQKPQFQFSESLEKGFQSQKYPNLPFQFQKIPTSKIVTKFGGLLGGRTAFGLLGGVQTKTAQAVATSTRKGTLTRQLTGTKQVSRKITKPKTKVTGTNAIVQGLTGGVGGIGGFGGFRPGGIIRPLRISRPGSPGQRMKRTPSKKKKKGFKLEITGFQAVTGRRRPTKRKKLSEITGFELLR